MFRALDVVPGALVPLLHHGGQGGDDALLDALHPDALVQELEKSVKPHVITFEKRTVEWVKLCKLIKADDPSPFPALTQIEIYGKICRN